MRMRGERSGGARTMADNMCDSVMESREDVASSYRTMGEPLRIARAMATRCFSPPVSHRGGEGYRDTYQYGDGA